MDKKSKKIHIAFGLPSFLFGGGIEKQLLTQLPLFDRERFSLSLITLFNYPGRPAMFDKLPSDVSMHRLAFRNAFDVWQWRKLYKVLKHLKPDIVVSSMFSANAAFRMLKPFLGYKAITREHNTYTDKKVHHSVIEHLLAPLSDSIVAVSKNVADFASRQARVPREKFTVIHNGVEFDAIQEFKKNATGEVQSLRNELNLKDEQKIILNVARLKPQKNHRLLIDAFELFLNEHPDHVLLIAGDGSERPNIEAHITEKHLGDKVRLLGYRPSYPLFAAADFFVLTSRIEGFPNVGLESMAFGIPMISTQVSGVDEFIKDGKNGFIVEHNAQAVAQKMSALAALSPQEREAYQTNCLQTAQQFDIKKTVAQYEELFLSCVSDKTPSV